MKRNVPKPSGTTLGVVIFTLAVIMVIVGIAASYTTNIGRHVQRSNSLGTAIALGDSSLELLFASWRDTCRKNSAQALSTRYFAPSPPSGGSPVPTPATSYFSNIAGLSNPLVKRGGTSKNQDLDPTQDADYNATYTISNYKVIAVSPEWTGYSTSGDTPIPAVGPANTGNLKTSSLVYSYVASADVTLPSLGPGGKVVAKVRRVFQKQQVSPWSFAIFYVDPLEIHPGPNFVINGWVHTNADLYTAHDTLTFTDKVTYAGDWFKTFMPGDGKHPETPASPNYPGSPNYPTGLPYNGDLPPARDVALQPFGLDSTQIFNTTDPNPNNDSYRELIEPPSSAATDPLQGSRYWEQAAKQPDGTSGIVIQVKDNLSPTTPGFDGVKGHDLVTIGIPKSDGTITTLPSSDSLYQMFSGAITTNQSIQDNREGATIPIATLDVSKLETSVSSGNPTYNYDSKKTSAAFNGIVYFYDASATNSLNSDGTLNASAVKRGVRLKNGSKIPISGLTVASPNPVYLQGDFNTGDTSGTGANVPSNDPSKYDSDPATPAPDPQVAGYTRAPSSVVADAVNILSNSWKDGVSGATTAASPTTINTAIISGIVPTNTYGDNGYSGGAENFPRFLEDWSKDSSKKSALQPTLTYYGSMVELFKSQQSIGEWGKANVYTPPMRQWFFDTNFKTNPPPGSIMVYSYLKGRWSLL